MATYTTQRRVHCLLHTQVKYARVDIFDISHEVTLNLHACVFFL